MMNDSPSPPVAKSRLDQDAERMATELRKRYLYMVNNRSFASKLLFSVQDGDLTVTMELKRNQAPGTQ